MINKIAYFAFLPILIYMRFYPMLVFWLCWGALTVFVARYPDSPVVRILFYQFGPIPKEGESESGYLLKWSLLAFKYTVIFVFFITAGGVSTEYFPGLKNSNIFLGIFFFGLPLLAGMGTLGCLLLLIKAIWIRIFGRERYFRSPGD